MHVCDPSKELDAHRRQLHQATIIKRNKVLASAINTPGSRKMGAGYSDYTIHAERAVVKQLGDISQLRGATLIVVRYNRKGEVLNSKPCSDCQLFLDKCMREYGLRKVIHS